MTLTRKELVGIARGVFYTAGLSTVMLIACARPPLGVQSPTPILKFDSTLASPSTVPVGASPTGIRPDSEEGISSFKECVARGYPASASYPRQCRTPKGLLFTERIEDRIAYATTFGGPGSEFSMWILPTLDGGYLITGQTQGLGLLLKVDAFGNTEWEKTVGGEADAQSIVLDARQAPDGGYFVERVDIRTDPGKSQSARFLMELDSEGVVERQEELGFRDGATLFLGSVGNVEWLDGDWHTIIRTSDGGYAMFGADVEKPSLHARLAKLAPDGHPQWSRTIEHAVSANTADDGLIQTSDGGYALLGWGWFVRMDRSGEVEWEYTFAGKGHSVVETPDGGFLIAGSRDRDGLLMKLHHDGVLEWESTLGGIGEDVLYAIALGADGGYAVLGTTYSYGAGDRDLWLIKVEAGGAE